MSIIGASWESGDSLTDAAPPCAMKTAPYSSYPTPPPKQTLCGWDNVTQGLEREDVEKRESKVA